MEPSLEYGWYTCYTPLEETDFPFAGRYQLQITCRLGAGPCSLSPFSAGILACLSLYRHFTDLLCAATISVSSCVYRCCCIWKTRFPWNHPPPLALTIFPLLLNRSWALREGADEGIPFKTAPESLTLCTLSSCRSLLMLIYCKKHLWWGLVSLLTVDIAVYHQESFYSCVPLVE